MIWAQSDNQVPTGPSASGPIWGLMCLLIFVVLAFTLVALIVGILIRRSQARNAAQSPEARKIAQIARDFPDEVRAWGGADALRSPQNVRALIAKLERG